MQTAAFALAQITRQREDSGQAWLEFLNLPTLSMGVYHVPAGTNDRTTHEPHVRDEVYVCVQGRGRLTANGEEFDVEDGSVVASDPGVGILKAGWHYRPNPSPPEQSRRNPSCA